MLQNTNLLQNIILPLGFVANKKSSERVTEEKESKKKRPKKKEKKAKGQKGKGASRLREIKSVEAAMMGKFEFSQVKIVNAMGSNMGTCLVLSRLPSVVLWRTSPTTFAAIPAKAPTSVSLPRPGGPCRRQRRSTSWDTLRTPTSLPCTPKG